MSMSITGAAKPSSRKTSRPRGPETISRNNPTEPLQLASAPRCLARTRSGTACQSPVMRGRKRCRLHGGASPGAPTGEANGNYKHGMRTKAAIAERRKLTNLARAMRDALAALGDC
ncbi:HGGxSTG domain-containing protein [Sphingopyxis sp.]|uniref:HGGxSTG domain-containing protein n=1 Tax=Sphingopyxis sp. TaxID=1908224 RepID=UPI0035B0D3E9